MASKKIGLRSQILSALNDFVQIQSQDGENTKLDVLRAFEKEARLLYETEAIVTNFELDPFELFRSNNDDGDADDDADTNSEAGDDAAVHTHKRQQIQEAIQHLQSILEVTSCSRTRTGINRGDYCQIEADVEFQSSSSSALSSSSSSSSATNQPKIQLSFRYERKRRQGTGNMNTTGFHIRYAIELSINHQHKDDLLVVEVWSPYNTPSLRTPARCRNDELMDGMDDDDGSDENNNENDDERKYGNDATKSNTHEAGVNDSNNSSNNNNINDDERNNPKRRKLRNDDNMDAIIIMDNDDNTGAAAATTTTTTSTTTTSTPKTIADKPDEYITYMDPDVLRKFLEVTNLYPKYETAIDECTAYFLLMTFPFYEHEWDLVGYICESIFTGDDASDDDDNDDDDNDNDNDDELNTRKNEELE